ncbi:MAG: putative glutamine amidotransferase [Solirubrobacteraceae bacterium]|nr:putative glutamine amidotransferase [Solirubrobacteraceae bacterium]
MTSPLVGISASFHDFGDYGGVGVPRPLVLGGAIPVLLPRVLDALDATLDRLDGVVLAPGRDIDPSCYGAERSPSLAATEPERDRFELELVPRVLERGLPVLGMCRGIQILNVALGGTLVQHLGDHPAWGGHPSDPGWSAWKRVEHASLLEEPPGEHPRHAIAIEPGSLLAEALGTTSAEVNSFHHQAIDRLADGLTVTATAPDGVIEAVEVDGAPVLAVQWELQEEWRIDRRFLGAFEWFAAACAGRPAPRRRRRSASAAAG